MRRRAFLSGAAVLVVSRGVRADAIDDKLAAIARARANMKTLVGPFTQIATVGLLRSQVQSSGTLYLQYPNRLRWELGPPDSVTYWVAPEGLAYRGLHGSGRIPAGSVEHADVDALRALLGGDVTTLRARFDVREAPSQAGGPAFDCTPKDPSAKLKRLTFELDADLVRPKRALIVYDNRNQTSIAFGELRRDAAIDPALLVLP